MSVIIPATSLRSDFDLARQFAGLLLDSHPPGSWLELRAINAHVDRRRGRVIPAGRESSVVAYAKSPIRFGENIRTCIPKFSAYANPNATTATPPERIRNGINYMRRGEGIAMDQLSRMRWFIVDIDPPRRHAQGILLNSSDGEMGECVELGRNIQASLPGL